MSPLPAPGDRQTPGLLRLQSPVDKRRVQENVSLQFTTHRLRGTSDTVSEKDCRRLSKVAREQRDTRRHENPRLPPTGHGRKTRQDIKQRGAASG